MISAPHDTYSTYALHFCVYQAAALCMLLYSISIVKEYRGDDVGVAVVVAHVLSGMSYWLLVPVQYGTGTTNGTYSTFKLWTKRNCTTGYYTGTTTDHQ